MMNPTYRTNPIYRKILSELRRLSLRQDVLQDYLTNIGVDLPLMVVDEWATNDHLREIALYLDIRPSILIALRGDVRATMMAILDELWQEYGPRLNISKQAAWEVIESSAEFRGCRPDALRDEVALILDAMSPPPAAQIMCYWLDCRYRCVTTCRQTGRIPGA